MAKLTLSFKGHIIDAFHAGKASTLIGRDPGCDIRIDSLAIAPVHAQLAQKQDAWRLAAIDSGYPVRVNQKVVTEAELHHGDVIQLGKHTLTFSDDAISFATHQTKDDDVIDLNLDPPLLGYIQILNGSNIGRIIPLIQSLTRLGHANHESAIVAHRGNGFFLSRLEGDKPITVNDQPLEERSLQLHDGDVIEIGNVQMRFHLEDTQEMKKAGEG